MIDGVLIHSRYYSLPTCIYKPINPQIHYHGSEAPLFAYWDSGHVAVCPNDFIVWQEVGLRWIIWRVMILCPNDRVDLSNTRSSSRGMIEPEGARMEVGEKASAYATIETSMFFAIGFSGIRNQSTMLSWSYLARILTCQICKIRDACLYLKFVTGQLLFPVSNSRVWASYQNDDCHLIIRYKSETQLGISTFIMQPKLRISYLLLKNIRHTSYFSTYKSDN